MLRDSLPEKDLERFRKIKILIESGSIKKMIQLNDSSSTKIAKYTGINQGRYSSKLYKPGDFTMGEISKIAYLLDVDATLIAQIIAEEIKSEESLKVDEKIQKDKDKKAQRLS